MKPCACVERATDWRLPDDGGAYVIGDCAACGALVLLALDGLPIEIVMAVPGLELLGDGRIVRAGDVQ